MEGAGNDYVLVDEFEHPVEDPSRLSQRVSDRHRGVGSDGLLLVGPSSRAAATMRIFNADGSEGRMCGNGLRCVVRYLIDAGRVSGPEVSIDTVSGTRRAFLADGLVEVDMGLPRFAPADVPALLDAEPGGPARHPLPSDLVADPPSAFAVSIGNPHLVVRVPSVETVDLALHGAALADSERMPEGANVHFVTPTRDDLWRARPWERGSGATRACGSGAVAVAAVVRALGWSDADVLTVAMPGGELRVRWDGGGSAWLSGPARLVYRGELLEP